MGELAIDNPAFEGDLEPKYDAEIKERDENPERKGDIISRSIEAFWKTIGHFYKTHIKLITRVILLSLTILFIAYFIVAIDYKVQDRRSNNCSSDPVLEYEDFLNSTNSTTPDYCDWAWCSGHGFLIIMTSVIFVGLLYFQVLKRLLRPFFQTPSWKSFEEWWRDFWNISWIQAVAYLIPIALIIVFLILDTQESRDRLRSLLGLAVLVLFGALFSKHPGKINWKPVYIGMLMQFVFGLVTIRWRTGRSIFKCFGDKVTIFLNYTYDGSSFVYGSELAGSVFAFQVLPTIFFFSFFVQILYYWGTMQWFVMKLGWILQASMGTTVCESVNAAASIFLGQSEAPLIIKPYIKDLTKSEFHAIMTAGFATVSGSVLAAYISFGANASHLLTSSVMSAPAALCYAKLFFPESEESKTRADNMKLEKGDETGVLDAASKGAMSAITLVLGIIANLVAFVSAISFLDGVIGWLGMLVGLDVSFTLILTKIFYPLVWIMGVPQEDCSFVAEVVALKTVVNEFIAYRRLGDRINDEGLNPRSELIATYALCGFSNPSSIGILIGALSSMAPERRSDISGVAFRAFLSGCAVCFMTACVAGVLTDD